MFNPDKHNEKMNELRMELFNSMKGEDAEAQEKAFLNFTEGLENSVMDAAKEQMNRIGNVHTDEQILINRGVRRALTSEEKKYFNAVVERGGFDKVNIVFPTTIIQDVFKNLTEEHPLISRVDARDTTALATYIFAKPNKATAYWGPICEDIRQMILEGFEEIDLKSSRLSGFVAVCKGMLELGPDWLAQYIITLIYEIMATALETAIVQGTGDNQPIGMIKKLSGAVDSVYPDKEKVTLTDLTAVSMAGFRGALAKAKLDSSNVAIIVNPVTYWAKLFTSLVFRADTGTFVLDQLATGEEIITSYAVPEDTLIIGDPRNYFLGVAGDTRIDEYDQTLAIEDMQLYIAKWYGYGLAKDANAFFVADISGVQGVDIPELDEYKVPLEDEDNLPGA